MKKVDCPCKDCTHHGEPRCTHDENCYQGEEFARWKEYHEWLRVQKLKIVNRDYQGYAEDRHIAIKRKYGR